MEVQPEMPEKIAYRIAEAVHVSGLGRTTIYDEIKNSRLRAVKVAGRRLILREDLVAFLKAATQPAGNATSAPALSGGVRLATDLRPTPESR